MNVNALLKRLRLGDRLKTEEYEEIVNGFSPDTAAFAAELANEVRNPIYSNTVYIRGLIEVGNFCRNDCYYCGIRHSNNKVERYKLTIERILECCHEGYALGFRTFVLQGGEGLYSVKKICEIVSKIKSLYPECAVTLSLGEYDFESYRLMREAGADRYLLRHETADEEHYSFLHPKELKLKHRMDCLHWLKQLGFQTGCGFMVGSPGQCAGHIAKDLKFIEEFQPEMCGIGPFIPQKDTPFGGYAAGSAELTIYLLSVIRLIRPEILLPATTALGSILPDGRERGILAGANVIMPNLSPFEMRAKYALYDNKLSTGSEAAENLNELRRKLDAIGFKIVTARGSFGDKIESCK